jgi:hypothetical protein
VSQHEAAAERLAARVVSCWHSTSIPGWIERGRYRKVTRPPREIGKTVAMRRSARSQTIANLRIGVHGGLHIIGAGRNNSSHLHRPWRATSVQNRTLLLGRTNSRLEDVAENRRWSQAMIPQILNGARYSAARVSSAELPLTRLNSGVRTSVRARLIIKAYSAE